MPDTKPNHLREAQSSLDKTRADIYAAWYYAQQIKSVVGHETMPPEEKLDLVDKLLISKLMPCLEHYQV